MKLTLVASVVTALLQSGIAIVEMALWKYPCVYTQLKYDEHEARKVAPIVMNAGLYNAFLAAGLIWGIMELRRAGRRDVLEFFLACVAIAGIFGAVTLETKTAFPTTLFIQTLPAALGLAGLRGRFN